MPYTAMGEQGEFFITVFVHLIIYSVVVKLVVNRNTLMVGGGGRKSLVLSMRCYDNIEPHTVRYPPLRGFCTVVLLSLVDNTTPAPAS